MSPDGPDRGTLPEQVRKTLDQFGTQLDLEVRLWSRSSGERDARLYPPPDGDDPGEDPGALRDDLPVVRILTPREGPELELHVWSRDGLDAGCVAPLLHDMLERTYDCAQEIRFFTFELSERYEEINLLYSISETLGSILQLDDAASVILDEVCDVLGARRGSLWVYDPDAEVLHLRASVGDGGLSGPLSTEHPQAITARVFREGRPLITAEAAASEVLQGVTVAEEDTFLSVPIRYTPPSGEPRTVGVINLIGHRRGGHFTASDQKLLSAIASQIGAALENNRLIRESLRQERMTHEMELAHNLQMKLLPSLENFDGASVAARVRPHEQVGGDFYQVFKLSGGRIGVMIGDVSSHGFPAALIMALSMSAATIYASEFDTPPMVIRHLDDALRDELETTEMYLTLFYGVLDPSAGRLVYANAGHPHAFITHADGVHERLDATDPPVGFAGPDSYGQATVPWDPEGDLLLLFTDGLSDTLTSEETGRGEDFLLELVAGHRHETPARLVDVLFDYAERITPSIPSDDRTALVLKT